MRFISSPMQGSSPVKTWASSRPSRVHGYHLRPSTNCEKLSDLDHKHVNHGRGEFARDDDGLCEVHVHTMEGFWSLLRSWLRPHRGISQEKLPVYLGFFAFVHNVRKRGKALLPALIELLVT